MKLTKMTIAVTNMDDMVNFYNAVFDTGLKSIPESPFYVGQLLDMQLLFCPNSIAEVNAEKNRLQLSVVVEDIDSLIEQAKNAGGSLYDDWQDMEQMIVAGIKDPDGNSFEIIQLKS